MGPYGFIKGHFINPYLGHTGKDRAMSQPYGSIMGSLNGFGFIKRKKTVSEYLLPESLNICFQNLGAIQVSKGPSPYF